MTMRGLTGITLLCALGPMVAHAQDGSPPSICGAESEELMQRLDGTWSFTQHRGRAVGTATIPIPAMNESIRGMVPTMLPGQDPVSLQLEYLPNFGLSILSGQGQTMIMLPADRERAVEELQHQWAQDGEAPQSDGPQCADGSLPVLVGTNSYQLLESPTEVEAREADLPLAPIDRFCTDNPYFGFLVGVGIVPEDHGSEQTIPRWEDEAGRNTCDYDDDQVLASGEMRMTIIVEFQSPTSGSGYIYFDGEMGDIEFSALAGVTLTR